MLQTPAADSFVPQPEPGEQGTEWASVAPLSAVALST